LTYNPEARRLANTQGEIRVGPSHQAKLPPCINAPLLPSTNNNNGKQEELIKYDYDEENKEFEQCTWGYNTLTDSSLMTFLQAARSIAAFAGICDRGNTDDMYDAAQSDASTYYALQCLHDMQYDEGKTLQYLVKNPAPPGCSIDKKWTEEEQKKFVKGLRQYGKNFFRIRKELLPNRETGELVEFYYLWKKTPAASNSRPRRRLTRPASSNYNSNKKPQNGAKNGKTNKDSNSINNTNNKESNTNSNNNNNNNDSGGSDVDSDTNNNDSDESSDQKVQSQSSATCCTNCLTSNSKDWQPGGLENKLLCYDCRMYYKKYGELPNIVVSNTNNGGVKQEPQSETITNDNDDDDSNMLIPSQSNKRFKSSNSQAQLNQNIGQSIKSENNSNMNNDSDYEDYDQDDNNKTLNNNNNKSYTDIEMKTEDIKLEEEENDNQNNSSTHFKPIVKPGLSNSEETKSENKVILTPTPLNTSSSMKEENLSVKEENNNNNKTVLTTGLMSPSVSVSSCSSPQPALPPPTQSNLNSPLNKSSSKSKLKTQSPAQLGATNFSPKSLSSTQNPSSGSSFRPTSVNLNKIEMPDTVAAVAAAMPGGFPFPFMFNPNDPLAGLNHFQNLLHQQQQQQNQLMSPNQKHPLASQSPLPSIPSASTTPLNFLHSSTPNPTPPPPSGLMPPLPNHHMMMNLVSPHMQPLFQQFLAQNNTTKPNSAGGSNMNKPPKTPTPDLNDSTASCRSSPSPSLSSTANFDEDTKQPSLPIQIPVNKPYEQIKPESNAMWIRVWDRGMNSCSRTDLQFKYLPNAHYLKTKKDSSSSSKQTNNNNNMKQSNSSNSLKDDLVGTNNNSISSHKIFNPPVLTSMMNPQQQQQQQNNEFSNNKKTPNNNVNKQKNPQSSFDSLNSSSALKQLRDIADRSNAAAAATTSNNNTNNSNGGFNSFNPNSNPNNPNLPFPVPPPHLMPPGMPPNPQFMLNEFTKLIQNSMIETQSNKNTNNNTPNKTSKNEKESNNNHNNKIHKSASSANTQMNNLPNLPPGMEFLENLMKSNGGNSMPPFPGLPPNLGVNFPTPTSLPLQSRPQKPATPQQEQRNASSSLFQPPVPPPNNPSAALGAPNPLLFALAQAAAAGCPPNDPLFQNMLAQMMQQQQQQNENHKNELDTKNSKSSNKKQNMNNTNKSQLQANPNHNHLNSPNLRNIHSSNSSPQLQQQQQQRNQTTPSRPNSQLNKSQQQMQQQQQQQQQQQLNNAEQQAAALAMLLRNQTDGNTSKNNSNPFLPDFMQNPNFANLLQNPFNNPQQPAPQSPGFPNNRNQNNNANTNPLQNTAMFQHLAASMAAANQQQQQQKQHQQNDEMKQRMEAAAAAMMERECQMQMLAAMAALQQQGPNNQPPQAPAGIQLPNNMQPPPPGLFNMPHGGLPQNDEALRFHFQLAAAAAAAQQQQQQQQHKFM
jgi:hypothetical protein